MDKNKIIEAAAKLVAKGAYDKAIKEYQKVLEADPKDVRSSRRWGSCTRRRTTTPRPPTTSPRSPRATRRDGFFLKAVALYKQVLKLNPNLLDVNLKLAELHQQLQLMCEAMAYFQIVANHYDKAGDTKSSLDTLEEDGRPRPRERRVADQARRAVRAREHERARRVAEFRRAAEHLKRTTAPTTTCAWPSGSARSSRTTSRSPGARRDLPGARAIRSARWPSSRSASRPTRATSRR